MICSNIQTDRDDESTRQGKSKGLTVEYRTLPNAGLKVSAIGLGTNNFAGRLDYEQTRKVIHKCLDVGITLIDTASSYPLGKFGGSEKFIGRALGKRRQDVVLATKFGHDGG